MSDNKKIKMICFISDYKVWDDIIDDFVEQFYKNFAVYPNIMLAASRTWEKIDNNANFMQAEKIELEDPEMEPDEFDAIKTLSSFVGENYLLEFCMDEKLEEDVFVLVFDEDPTFDGLPYQNCVSESNGFYRRLG